MIACGAGAVRLTRLQKAGGKPLAAADFLRGTPLAGGHEARLMPRFRMTVEYDGGPYVGWQRQDNGHSVQGAIEKAILSLTGETVSVRGAGRTDSGVHAMGQVMPCRSCRGSGQPLPLQNAVERASEAGRRAGRRSSRSRRLPELLRRPLFALRRHYLYRISRGRRRWRSRPGSAWWVPKPLDHEAMHAAAQMLVGNHDFTTFRSAHCQANSPVRTLDRLDVTRNGELIEIRATAQSFLHNQIRSFAGTLKMVGEGKWTPDDVRGGAGSEGPQGLRPGRAAGRALFHAGRLSRSDPRSPKAGHRYRCQ